MSPPGANPLDNDNERSEEQSGSSLKDQSCRIVREEYYCIASDYTSGDTSSLSSNDNFVDNQLDDSPRDSIPMSTNIKNSMEYHNSGPFGPSNQDIQSSNVNYASIANSQSPIYVSYAVPLIVDQSSDRKVSILNNTCLIPLGNNCYSLIRAVTPSDLVLSKQSMQKPLYSTTVKQNTYRARQRKNYDSQSKHKILELYEHYSRSSKRMTVRNIALAIFRDLKKEKYVLYAVVLIK